MAVITQLLTYKDFLEYDFSEAELKEYWHELINGEIMRRNFPNIKHQSASANLFAKLYTFITERKLGKIFHPPTGVILSENDWVLPDLVFIANKNAHLIKDEGIFGAPDLIVEIISPSTLKDDRNDKKDLYQAAGVSEYWIIDPNNQSVEVFELIKKSFKIYSFAYNEGIIKSKILQDLNLDVKDLFN